MAHSLTLPSVGALPVGQLQGGGKSTRRAAARAAMGRESVQATPATLSVSPFQSFSGMRKASEVDSLSVKRGMELRSVVAKSTAVSKQSGASRAVTTAMFERFTEKAIKVIMLAQEEARRLGHNFVGTEQILLGLIGEGTGIAAKVLKSMGVNLKEARVEVEKIIGRGSGFVAVEIPFTPRAKRVLELSLEEARQLGEFESCVVVYGPVLL